MSLTEYVDRMIGFVRRRNSLQSRKLEIIRAAAQHHFPVSDIDSMLAEIEKGYSSVRDSN
jgi:hypothetical protein